MTVTDLRTELYNVATQGIRFSLSLPETAFTKQTD